MAMLVRSDSPGHRHSVQNTRRSVAHCWNASPHLKSGEWVPNDGRSHWMIEAENTDWMVVLSRNEGFRGRFLPYWR